MMIAIARTALALLLLAACRASDDDAIPASADATPAARPASAPRAPNVFHPDSVRVGDTVAGMRIEAMDVQAADDGERVGSVRFAGEARISGSPRPHPDGEVDARCFFADAASALRLPRFPHDGRRAWFCFANQADARRLLPAAADSAGVTIVIDGFTYHFARSDVFNEARLVRVEREDAG